MTIKTKLSLSFLLAWSVAVQAFTPNYLNSLSTPHSNGASSPSSPNNYNNNNLNNNASPPPEPIPPVISPQTGEPLETFGRPYLPPRESNTPGDLSSGLFHASLDEFHLDRLTPTGRRAHADVGDPHDASRDWVTMGVDESISAGAWWCAAGGWMSPKQRASTEIFFVLSGRGCVTDADGVPHEFGPGDTVTLPKGWSGRWDVLQDVHKVWFCHEHMNIEQAAFPIRAICTPFEKLMAPQYMSPMAGGSGAASRLIYHAGPTTVGCVVCAPGSSTKICHDAECFHILEGVLFLTPDDHDGQGKSQRCVAGDTVILPPGWSGHHDVVEKTTMLWINMEEEHDDSAE